MIEFDLSFLNDHHIVEEASLFLFFNNTSVYLDIETLNVDGHHGENSFYIQRIISPWEESQVVWNNQPAVAEDNKVLIPDNDDLHRDYTDIDVTALVVDMANDPENSFGFMLRHRYEEPYKATFFASSDHPDPQKRPKLVIKYK